MQELLRNWADGLLDWLGATTAQHASWDRWVACALVVCAAVVFDYVCRKVVIYSVSHMVKRTRALWDDELFNNEVLGRACHILSALLLSVVLPVVFDEQSEMRVIVVRLTSCYALVTIFRFVDALIRAAFLIVSARPAWQNKPIKGLRQTVQGIAGLICVVLVFLELFDAKPTAFLTGLSASAAVVLLIFRDSILGFVSGIQLSANDMLQVGDWIMMPKYGADGTVIEVTLTTVKVRNWDNTIVTLPPYVLVSDSFQNWQAMRRSGGRRVMRSVAIDMTSVRFATPELVEKYRTLDPVRDYVDRTDRRTADYNASVDIAKGERQIEGLQQTNLGLFRTYLLHYLGYVIPVNKSMTVMVRQLQPTEYGLPLQLYFFTDTVDWISYETIQAEVFEHLLAVIPEFGLRVFQSPTGADIAALRAGTAPETRGGAPTAGASARPE